MSFYMNNLVDENCLKLLRGHPGANMHRNEDDRVQNSSNERRVDPAAFNQAYCFVYAQSQSKLINSCFPFSGYNSTCIREMFDIPPAAAQTKEKNTRTK